ncbi:MAG: hypothetical protein IJ161_01560 [Bacteroidales bacterium]|nr:hypothetical protein [Bacteroidales bacterium]
MFGHGSLTRYEGKKTGTSVFEADVDAVSLNTDYSYLAYIVKGGEEIRSDTKTWSIPSDYVSSTIKISGISVEETEGGCFLRCKYLSSNPDLIESVWFTYSIAGFDAENMIEGKIVSDNEFEAFLTGLAPETIYSFRGRMKVGGEIFDSEESTWISPAFSDFVNVEAKWDRNHGSVCQLLSEVESLSGANSYGFYLMSPRGEYTSESIKGEKAGDNTFTAAYDIINLTPGERYYIQAYIVKGDYEYRSKLYEWTVPDYRKMVYIEDLYCDFIYGRLDMTCYFQAPSRDSVEDAYFLFGKTGSSLERLDEAYLQEDDDRRWYMFSGVASDFKPGEDYEYQAVIVSDGETFSSDVMKWTVPRGAVADSYVRVENYYNAHTGNVCFVGELDSYVRGLFGFLFGSKNNFWMEELHANYVNYDEVNHAGNTFGYTGPLGVELDPDTDYFYNAFYDDSDPNYYTGDHNTSYIQKYDPSSGSRNVTKVLDTYIGGSSAECHMKSLYFSSFPDEVTEVGFLFGKKGTTLQKIEVTQTSPFVVEATMYNLDPGVTYEFQVYVVIKPHDGYSTGSCDVYSEIKQWTFSGD